MKAVLASLDLAFDGIGLAEGKVEASAGEVLVKALYRGDGRKIVGRGLGRCLLRLRLGWGGHRAAPIGLMERTCHTIAWRARIIFARREIFSLYIPCAVCNRWRMKLHLYLAEHAKTAAQFADEIGIDYSTVTRWLTGASLPKWSTLIAIERVTGGLVRPDDFLPEKKGKRA